VKNRFRKLGHKCQKSRFCPTRGRGKNVVLAKRASIRKGGTKKKTHHRLVRRKAERLPDEQKVAKKSVNQITFGSDQQTNRSREAKGLRERRGEGITLDSEKGKPFRSPGEKDERKADVTTAKDAQRSVYRKTNGPPSSNKTHRKEPAGPL